MTLVAFTIPDDLTQLPGWLERRLLAPDFGQFVAELTATHPERGRARTPARQLLGDWYPAALADGLKNVPIGVLQQLLKHPKCLLELQEAVLTEGGPYWDELAEHAEELAPAFDRGRAALEGLFGPAPAAKPAARASSTTPRRESSATPRVTTPKTAEAAASPPSPKLEPSPGSPRSYFTWAVASSALAACLLIAVGFLALRENKPEVAGVNWGWAKPGGIPQTAPKPPDYLNGLATTAEEWFNKRPEDPASVAKRINEFRTGCTQLIFSPHDALAQKDREWLIEKCRGWAKKLDDHLTALEAGADPLKVRGEADETIRKLQNALHERAGQV